MIQTHELQKINDAFLERGGTFLRISTSKAGEPIIEQLNKFTNPHWKTRLTFTSEELRDKIFKHLTRKRKQFFKAN
jgi:hypothetical protein